MSQGLSLIEGFIDDRSKSINELPLVMFGDHTKNVKYIDFPFAICADGTHFHKAILIDSKWLYYWFLYSSSKIPDRGYARHYCLIKDLYIFLPPLNEQRRIVEAIEKIYEFIK